MKKVLSLVLASIMLISTAVLVSAAGFPDVDENYSWAEESINSLSKSGIITGYDDGTFMPGKDITRQEAITLFSKALGASEKVNEPIIDIAYGIYSGDLEKSSDSYAVRQGAYMIYKKVLTADEVNDYLCEENRNVTLKRYEAATLIAKALAADVWLKNDPTYELEFDDKDEIPKAAKGYVYYATALGIMNGVGDNKFAPELAVTRAQIAVMIQRILDSMEFEYVSGMISDVNATANQVSVKTDEGAAYTFTVTKNNVVFLDGTKVTVEDLQIGTKCVFTFSKEELYQVDAITFEGDETISGIFRGYQTTSAGTTFKIADINTEGSPVTSYKMASNAVVTYEGEAVNISKLELGNYVTVDIKDGLIATVAAEAKTQKIASTKIQNIEATEEGIVITLLTKNEETVRYALADEATIIRNSTKTTYDELAIGDSAEITLDYRKITNIMAVGKASSVSGKVEEITISNTTSYITVSTSGVKVEYPLSRDCTITIEEKESTIYDLRLNSNVTLKLASDTVTQITAEAASTSLTVEGTVKTVNASYGLVIITCENNGVTYDKQLFISDYTKIFNAHTGKSMALKNLAVGNKVTAAGTEKLGVYEVTSVMVFQ